MERLPTSNATQDAAGGGAAHLDESAIVALAQREPSAFAPLYETYLVPIYRDCYRRLGSREAAEDATSLIFERALRALPRYRGGAFRAWLFAIAHNAVTDSYRQRAADRPFAAALEVADPTPAPEQLALLADEQRLLMTALAQLPADQRQVIELRLSGITSIDVAVILGRSPQAVRALQLRATRRLQSLLAISNNMAEVREMPDRDRSLTPEFALDLYWDAILADRQPPAGNLDPGLATTVQRVHALDAASSPRPAFAAKLWEDLMSAQSNGSAIATQPGIPFDVRALSVPNRRFAATPPGPISRLVAAILLIVLLAGSAFAAIYPLRLWDNEELPVFAPLGPATMEPAIADEGVLVNLTLSDIPPYRSEGGIGVTTYPPGGSSREFVAKTAEVMYIAAGPLTVRVEEAAEPVRVLPPGAIGATLSSSPLSAREAMTLPSGSTLIAPPDAVIGLVNEGTTPGTMLDLLWATASGSSEAGGAHWTKGWGGKDLDLELPVSIVLRQLTLAAGESLPALDATNASQAAATVDPDREPDLLPMADGSLRNGGDEPLEIYVLTVTSGAKKAQASPAAQSPSTAGQFEFQWRFAGESDSLEQPYGMGIDREGNIWVAEAGKDRFQVIAPDGTYSETWGVPGSGDGEFEFLSTASLYGRAYGDIAFDLEGNIYVADTGNFRVQQFAPDRTFVRSWGSKGSEDGQFLAPSGIAIGANGVVYVSDETRSDVQMFDSDGRYLGTIGEKGTDDGQFTVPGGVTVDAAGDVWVANWGGRRIQRFTSSGDWVDTWGESGSDDEGGLRNPNDVAVDDRGRVYVVSDFNNRLHAFGVDGRFLATIGGAGSDPGEFSDPLGIALGRDGTVYVSDLNGVQAFRVVQP